ncbi:hypothetical protein HMPREF0183_0285 [Brevibacterium mcbrellneri ATCC 49030]|uniref:IS3 family transposase n=1 Tax=Brevibacterium mcbrellneri ATCC 49030 TaxID=585530 RepID=D4YK25_9MICO|nr:hypothetical protein HMPREF0183_0285 [Brevibacterium mcbrellneri ATCC 49030]
MALRVFKRTQSVTKMIRELGYPGRRTMHRWVREGVSPGRRRRQAKAAASYPVEVKLEVVELFHAGWRPDEIVVQCGVRSRSNMFLRVCD